MKKFLNNLAFAAVTAIVSMSLVVAFTSHNPVFADAKSDACQGVGLATGDTGAKCGDAAGTTNSINKLISSIINIFSWVVGIVAVVMILVGGFRFVTSGGDSSNVASARNTIIYAIVGLVVVAMAQIIVHFVLKRVS